MKWTLLVSLLLVTVNCRPQSSQESSQPNPVEILKQEIIEIPEEDLSQLHGYAELARELPHINETHHLHKFLPETSRNSSQPREPLLSLPEIKPPRSFTETAKHVKTKKPEDGTKYQETEKQDLIEITQGDSEGTWFQNEESANQSPAPNGNTELHNTSINKTNIFLPKKMQHPQAVAHKAAKRLSVPENLPIVPEAPQKEIAVEEQTKRILENIAAVNKRHGLTPKKRRPEYFYFPHSYSRSQSPNSEYDGFRFPTNPFANPIFDYLDRQRVQSDGNSEFKMNFQAADAHGDAVLEDESDDDNIDVDEDVPPGQYIKRKIVHKQTVAVPVFPPSNPQGYSGPMGIPSGQFGIQTGPQSATNGAIDYRNGGIIPPNAQVGLQSGIFGLPSGLDALQGAPIGIPNSAVGFQSGIPTQGLPYAPFGIPNVPLRGQNYVGPSTYDLEDGVTADEHKDIRNKTLSSLEKETVNNIKNIVLNSHLPHQQLPPVHLNPYRPPYPYSPYPYSPYPNPAMGYLGNSQINPNLLFNYLNAPNLPNASPYAGGYNNYGYNYQLYGPFVVPNIPAQQQAEPRQQFQWPWAQFFPIIIKDPMMQLMNAVTSMIEYGPQATCKHGHNRLSESDEFDRDAKKIGGKGKLKYEIKNADTAPEITVENEGGPSPANVTTLDIEDLVIKADRSDPKKMTFGFKTLKTETREAKVNGDVATKVNVYNGTTNLLLQRASTHGKKPKAPSGEASDQKRISLFQFSTRPATTTTTTTEQAWIAIKDRPIFEDEQGDIVEAEAEAYEDQKDVSVSHDGNKKLFSKDNTGSGIFIHKLKVRKGGVAIAGPGGIATAGSGGTAIVGPNGLAYTHPDSLAIAGSGTKVVAVDPSINLGDLISGNYTRKDGTAPRVGKVVAVGPVVYYNKGDGTKTTITPYYGAGKGQSLQVIEYANGTVITSIIKTPDNFTEEQTEEPPFNITEYENPQLPSRYEQEFGSSIKNIHRTALKLIDLQEVAKKRGKLTEEEEEVYQENMDALNLSAKNLAELQDREESRGLGFENREGLEAWFDRKKLNQKEKEKKNKENAEKKKKGDEEEKRKKEEEEKAKRKEEEEKEKKKGEKEEESEEEEEEEGGDDDSITINLPPEDASVAEAKPVGLAIAGEGGVAASKPIATAVVGPGGLAIARPVATAIAGVAPDQALVPIYAQSFVSGSDPKNTVTRKPETNSEYLNRIISKYHQV